ncbi:hypothetical protein FGO68_gene16814 [Halteria grandinella]|uniref:Uncharacterized protein n=1 Tax=Halteria grandinella TaxID=5974 RepID=A0A8J8SUL6_HALGN|nr:hypothetical protein FGO68_gene16814 [Halteria grandinella]
MFLNPMNSFSLERYYCWVPGAPAKNPAFAPVPVPEAVVVLLNWPPGQEAVQEAPVVEGRCGSSSKSLSFQKTLFSCLYLSSSSTNVSGIINVRFLFTKLLVPTRPDTAQSMPLHWRLKLLCICFRRSSALISCWGRFGGWEDSFAEDDWAAPEVPVQWAEYWCYCWVAEPEVMRSVAASVEEPQRERFHI